MAALWLIASIAPAPAQDRAPAAAERPPSGPQATQGRAVPPLGNSAPDLAVLAPLDAEGPVSYFMGVPAETASAMDGDMELCSWALADWQAAAEGRVAFESAADEESARIRIYFVPPGYGLYGEMRPLDVNGQRGAAVYIRPDTDALGPPIAQAAREDPLMRETVVYLTCLHELGHALGLEHTADFSDVMYFFGFGGDIAAFFGRYRVRLEHREDIAGVSGLSSGDRAQLERLYPSR